jgi:general stress protein 26
MNENELKTKIAGIAKKYPLAVVATVKDNKPFARYMMLDCDNELNFTSATFAKSRKVSQIEKNNNVCAVMGSDTKNMELPYMNIYGTATISTDAETKKKIWCEHLKNYFKGPDDPNYVVVKIKPSYIEAYLPGQMEPEILKF